MLEGTLNKIDDQNFSNEEIIERVFEYATRKRFDHKKLDLDHMDVGGSAKLAIQAASIQVIIMKQCRSIAAQPLGCRDGYFFSSDDVEDTFFFLRRDDHIQLSLEYFF